MIDLGNTYTNSDAGQPGLTLEQLEKTIADLEARLPILHYATSKFLPVLRDDGEPMMYWVPTSVYSPFDRESDRVTTHLLLFHPDNLAHVLATTMWHYQLVSIQRPSPQEPTP